MLSELEQGVVRCEVGWLSSNQVEVCHIFQSSILSSEYLVPSQQSNVFTRFHSMTETISSQLFYHFITSQEGLSIIIETISQLFFKTFLFSFTGIAFFLEIEIYIDFFVIILSS